MKAFSMQLTRRSSAPPEALYDSLADLRTHAVWGGAQQLHNFRLRSLEAPAGPATVGTCFSSTGTIPMSLRRFVDHSTVTVAQRPHTFEFVTEATVPGGRRAMAATYRHRYEVIATPDGSEVSYTMTQLSASNLMLRLSLPGLREVTWGAGIPFMAGRGFRNLLAHTERKSRLESASKLSPQVNR